MSATQRTALFVVPPAVLVLALIGLPFLRRESAAPQQAPFELVEATIGDVHRAIQQGQITCRGLVEAYLQRYDGRVSLAAVNSPSACRMRRARIPTAPPATRRSCSPRGLR